MMAATLDRRVCVAPMMDWTDRHCRFLHRLLSPHALLYSEMIHANAILRGDRQRHLYFRPEEGNVALQLGGNDPVALAEAAKYGEDFGYCEINLNCGCPSDRVQSGAFGACLMHEPHAVADMVAAMRAAVKIPVTVKTRLGVDAHDDYDFLCRFIDAAHGKGGCDMFVLHARKAWLTGLSPKENRDIPPLDWERVHRIKRDYPQLTIITNGGFQAIEDCVAQLAHVDGVMIGRKAYHEPFFLALLEQEIFAAPLPTREEIVRQLLDYMHDEKAKGTALKNITRHALGLYHATPVAKKWKHALMQVAAENDTAALAGLISAQAP